MKENNGTLNIEEQLPAQIIPKVLGGKDVRVAIAEHPVTKEMAACVPYKDYAMVFSYDESSIRQLIHRTNWIKKHSGEVIIPSPGGYQATLCLFEEGALGLFFKLQPSRCKDPDVAARVDQLQEELILILRDALKGYRTVHNGYNFKNTDGLLPRPGLTMDAISDLCKEADKYLKGRASLRALNFFTGMPVADLLEEMEREEPENSPLAGVIVQYFHALLAKDPAMWGIEKGTTEEGTVYLQGETANLFNAFISIGKQERLPKFFSSPVSLGTILRREAEGLEFLGWRRAIGKKIAGYRQYRYECMKAH